MAFGVGSYQYAKIIKIFPQFKRYGHFPLLVMERQTDSQGDYRAPYESQPFKQLTFLRVVLFVIMSTTVFPYC